MSRFIDWLKIRENAAEHPGDVETTTDPKEIARRKAVSDITSGMMKKNPQLKPGKTNQQTVATSMQSDPNIAKADPKTQQAVSGFFLNDDKPV